MTNARKRPTAADSRARMLASGRQIIARSGLRGLTVRGVAVAAKVNLGTFVYHFGTREKFIAELMESWYAPIYGRLLNVTVDDKHPPLERLRRFLLQLAAFMTENRRFARNILMDAAGEERAAIDFIKSLLGRHPLLLFRLIREAQRSGDLRAGNPVKIGIFLFGATLFPSVWMGVLLPDRLVPGAIQPLLQKFAFAPAQIERRFNWALCGLIPARTPGKGRHMKTKRRSSSSRSEALS
jgi:TetR/AcrR family transcriptional repressor of nem operon